MFSQPPFGLAPTAFRFRALAALAGRLPIGGEREVAMAAFIAARLAAATRGSDALSAVVRRSRAAGARHWIGALAIPAATRTAMMQVADLSADGDGEGLASALDRVATHVAGVLDAASRTELRQLVVALRK